MTIIRLASLVGVALLVMVLNVGASILYMVLYGHAINPGHPEEFYKEHVKVAAPYCSIIVGIPLMFLAGYWVAGWWGGALGLKAALIVWLVYAIIDVGVLVASGANARLTLLVAISMLTKLAAAFAGATLATRLAAQHAQPLP